MEDQLLASSQEYQMPSHAIMNDDIETLKSIHTLTPQLSALWGEEEKEYKKKLMGTAAVTTGLLVSLFRYTPTLFRGPLRSFLAVVCFPSSVMISLNHYFLFPDYYLSLLPIFRTLIFDNNSEFLAHLKDVHMKHRGEFFSEERAFERFLEPDEIVSWRKKTPAYEFEEKDGLDLTTKYLIDKIIAESA